MQYRQMIRASVRSLVVLLFTLFGARALMATDFGAHCYVSDGLVSCWDGIDNTGRRVHDPDATNWVDCVNGYSFALTSVTVLENGMSFNGSTSGGKMTEHANDAFPAGEKTVEVLVKLNSGASGNVFHGPTASGCSFGPYNSYILINNINNGHYHPIDKVNHSPCRC